MDSPAFYSVEEVAHIFGRTRRTVYQWLKTKQITGVKMGGRWYFPKADIDQLVAPQTITQRAVSDHGSPDQQQEPAPDV